MDQVDFKKIEDFDSIKNSKFYDILKDFDILKMTSKQEEEIKIFILSLSIEEQEAVIVKFLDNDYLYTEINDERNEKMGEFMSDSRLEIIYDSILEKVPQY